MASANIEVVRRMYDDWMRGDFTDRQGSSRTTSSSFRTLDSTETVRGRITWLFATDDVEKAERALDDREWDRG